MDDTPVWSVYLVRTAGGALYTGISTDPARRLREHASGPRGARALRGKGPLDLVFTQAVGNRSAAQRIEARIKGLRREDKERVISGSLTLADIDARHGEEAP